MLINAERFGTRFLPGLWKRRGIGDGSNGSISDHRSSSRIYFPILLASVARMKKASRTLDELSASCRHFEASF
ncbi:hypothetical protein ABT364_19760 [Massilia sp. SR12]